MKIGAFFLFAPLLGLAQNADKLTPVANFPEKNMLTPIGPQAWHRDIYRKAGPWAIHVIEFDLRHIYLQLETVKASDHLQGKERTSQMVARRDEGRHRVVAAINGDFYDTSNGIPINLQMRDGEIVRHPTTRSIFAVSAAEKPLINFLSLVGSLQSKAGVWQTLNGFNRNRNADELVFYNHYFGSSTNTNNFGSEIRIQPLKKFAVNDTIRAVVRAFTHSAGNSPLNSLTYVISGHGVAENWLNKNIAVGDIIKFVWRIPETPWRLVEAIGGLPRIVRDGRISIENQNEGGSESFTNTRHPRTALGFNADTSRYYFVTVDGRQPGYSEGMTLSELASFMRELGCMQALNLDGGGSTTMVVRGHVVNRPSDASGERAVANAVLLVSNAPPGRITQLDITASRVVLRPGEKFDFNMLAADNYYNPLNLLDKEVTWKVPKRLGKIDKHGIFTAGVKADSGYVLAYRQQARDSARVVVRSLP